MWKTFFDAPLTRLARKDADFERKHPRHSAGTAQGGEFAPNNATHRANPDTAAFKKWFGGSKIVDENGKPRVVYHGTSARFEKFDITKAKNHHYSRRALPAYFFTANEDRAALYGKNVVPVYLKMKNPMVVVGDDADVGWVTGLIQDAIGYGHDGIILKSTGKDSKAQKFPMIYRNTKIDTSTYIVFDPKQIVFA